MLRGSLQVDASAADVVDAQTRVLIDLAVYSDIRLIVPRRLIRWQVVKGFGAAERRERTERRDVREESGIEIKYDCWVRPL